MTGPASTVEADTREPWSLPILRPPRSPHLAAAFALVGAALVLATVDQSPALGQAETTRIAGDDRFVTAAELAAAAFDRGEYALIARGGDFPDALAAARLAGELDAPILLTNQHAVPQVTLDAMERLGVGGAVLLGGTAAIREDVEEQLRDEGYAVDRIAGQDRYHTAIEVAREVGASDTVWLASGAAFPDALAAGAPSARTAQPLLLTLPDRLPDDVEAAIGDLGAQRVIIVGGPAAVSPRVERDIEEGGVTVQRLAGRDRTDTAVQVAAYADEAAGSASRRSS